MENERKHKDIKFVTTEKRTNYLLSEPNYHSTTFSTENLLAIEMRKTQMFMNKLVYLGFSTLELSKIVMYEQDMEIWRHSFNVYIKTGNIYKDISKDVEKKISRFKLWIRQAIT